MWSEEYFSGRRTYKHSIRYSVSKITARQVEEVLEYQPIEDRLYIEPHEESLRYRLRMMPDAIQLLNCDHPEKERNPEAFKLVPLVENPVKRNFYLEDEMESVYLFRDTLSSAETGKRYRWGT
jgi:hypothetical protein